jgi:hypothetical protein
VSRLPEFGDLGPNFQFTSLTGADRLEIVQLAGDLNIDGSAYIPAKQFDLTALGADVDLDGIWNATGFDLAEWRHVATGGRDQYVRIVLKGYLFPFGHRAVLVQIAERILIDDPANPTSWSDAVLQLSTYVKVQQTRMAYPAVGQPFFGASWPFVEITMKTLVTPPLVGILQLPQVIPAPSTSNPSQAVRLQPAFTPSTTDVIWTAIGKDVAGNEMHLEAPLCFMFGYDTTIGYANEFDPTPYTGGSTPSGGVSSQVAQAYNALDPSHRTVQVNGSKICYALPAHKGPQGATTHPTSSFQMLAALTNLDPTAPSGTPSGALTEAQLAVVQQPAFYPCIGSARVRLPAAEGLSRAVFSDSTSAANGPGVALQYYAPWVTAYQEALAPYSPTGNPGNVYMEFVDYAASTPNPPQLTFPADAVGGVGCPNITTSGLSATAGLVSGNLDNYAQAGSQSPAQYFPNLTGPSAPQLLGGLKLFNILGKFTDPNGMPTVVNDPDPTTGTRTITYTMHADTQDWGTSQGTVFHPLPSGSGEMTLTATVQIAQNGTSTYKVVGSVSPFNVNVLGTDALDFILIPFNKCVFTAKSGSKPDIKVELGQIQFQGALQFVNALEQFLEDLGGSGFSVQVLPTQIKAGFSIGLPDIAIGVVSLSNLGISASVVVPFLGDPTLATFSFASKQKQFLVTVCMFGGGGYITLVLGLDSVQQVSASIEFAGNFSLDIGIASGGITLTAGIYYNYTAGQGVTLAGFVKLVGSLDVLGIISITITLDLSLTYHEENGQSSVAGTAELSASVHVLFFTVTIGVEIHKQFSGSQTNKDASMAAMKRMAASIAPPREKVRPKARPAAEATLAAANLTSTGITFSDLMQDTRDWGDYCSAFAS